MQPARCLDPSKSQYSSNHVDLNSKMHFYSCLVLSRLTYGAAESWANTGSQAAQLETFHNACMPHDGPVPGHGAQGAPLQLSC